jgi:hypothetical protein
MDLVAWAGHKKYDDSCIQNVQPVCCNGWTSGGMQIPFAESRRGGVGDVELNSSNEN